MSERPNTTPPSRTRPNYLYSIVSVALVLFLLGFFGMIILQTSQLVKLLKEQVNVIVEITETATDTTITELRMRMESNPYVKKGSISFITREEGLDMLREDFGEDFMKLDLPNPLFDVLTFNVRADYMNPDSLQYLKASLKIEPIVADVYYQEGLVQVLAQNIRKIGWFALGIGLFFIFVAFALIHNTIRLALYANRFLIKNMELVGASWEFISRPFIWRSIWHGMISGLMAIAFIYGMWWLARRDIPELAQLQNWLYLGLLFGGLILFGILISTGSTYFVVKKYLKMRVDDLY